MDDTLTPVNGSWPIWKKILFRFFFIYFIIYISPWNWLDVIPGADYLLDLYNRMFDWAVTAANAQFFHVFNIRNVKQVFNGSGDTSFAWAYNCLILVVAFAGALIWSVADRKRKNYRQLNYLLCQVIRYSLVLTAFFYGVIKIFALQMTFPQISQLATPLGDLLPMRLSWMFIGYSPPYEIFSGALEALAAVLLLYRRTTTLGLLMVTAVFINVMTLNLCYDIPVKLYSMNLVLLCFCLLTNDAKRLYHFLIANKTTAAGSLYDYPLTRKWMRITRIVLKLFIVFLMAKTISDTIKTYRIVHATTVHKDFAPGVYDVTKYVINKDTIPALTTDTIRWQDVIFEKNYMGSIHTRDTLFRKRYGRGYFFYAVDSLQPVISLKKSLQDDSTLISLNYLKPDSNTIQLWGKLRNDSVFIELKKSKRHFQLAERQFHWLSEANR